MEIIYGDAPDRMKFPDIDPEALNKEQEVDLEAIANFEELEKELEQYKKGYAFSMEKESCPVPSLE